MFYSFAAFLKVVDAYKTVNDCERDLLSRKKQSISTKMNSLNTPSEISSNKVEVADLKKLFLNSNYKKMIQIVIATIIILVIGIIFIFFKLETNTAVPEKATSENISNDTIQNSIKSKKR